MPQSYLTPLGQKAIRDFLLKNHVRGDQLIQYDHSLKNWYQVAEDSYNSGDPYPTIDIESQYCVSGHSVACLLYDIWFSTTPPLTQIGLEDKVRPDLMTKRVRDWG